MKNNEEPKEQPDLFSPHPILKDEMNNKIIEGELLGGADYRKVPIGKSLKIKTQSRTYTLERREDGFYISGHPRICPEPTKFNPSGSNFGGSSLKTGYVVRGGFFEGIFPDRPREHSRFVTSQVEEVAEE